MPIKAVLPGYPVYQGSKKVSVIDMKGLATYTPGGETITAAQFGEGGIDFIEPINKQYLTVNGVDMIVAASLSGTYFVTVKFGAGAVGAVASVIITWYVVATGVECGAIPLAAETVRLLAVFV